MHQFVCLQRLKSRAQRNRKKLVLAAGLTLILSTHFSKTFSKTPKEAEGHPFVKGRLTLYKQVSGRGDRTEPEGGGGNVIKQL